MSLVTGVPCLQVGSGLDASMNSNKFGWVGSLSLVACLLGCGGNSNVTAGGPQPQSPSLRAYSIGGTVSGLSGTLGLSNNGTDSLVLNASGAFSFGKPVVSGGANEVTIATQPSDPAQFCVVVNGTGTVSDNVTNIRVTCTTPGEQMLYEFGLTSDDNTPRGPLVFDNSGSLYGTNSGNLYGSSTGNGHGSVFKLTPANGQWNETVLYTFCQSLGCPDGANPASGVIWDHIGNLYGTTASGGTYGSGVVFQLSSDGSGGWTETVLHSFGNGTDGAGIFTSGLVFDNSGNLYGTTRQGGTTGNGTVFELSPNGSGGWTESVIYNFCPSAGFICPDGEAPMGGVAIGADGNLYGTTSLGGSWQFGTVFQLTRGTNGQWTEKVLHSFGGDPTDGTTPRAGVILDAAGNLYGTTQLGYCSESACNNGTVFEMVRAAGGQWQEGVLYGFHKGTDGSKPSGPVILDKAGNLYGTTASGGIVLDASGSIVDAGVVFALTPGSVNAMWAEVPLYSFPGGSNGAGPSGLVMDGQGNIYGVAEGGANSGGIIFEVTP